MSEVLHAISRSKFELSAVLESEAAARLCRSDGAVIFQLDGGVYRFAAGYSLLPAYLEIERQSIITPGPGTVVGRAAMTRQVIRIDDLLSDPHYELKEESKAEGNRSMIGVPLLRDGEPVVVIGMGRRRIDPFGDREIELATTFAAQAMIAIENARLLNELRQSLEQQKAASEVLQAISSAPGDLEPIFTTMLEKATRICEAEFAALYRLEGDGLRLAATYNVPPAFAQAEGMAFQPAPGGALDEAMKTGRTTHISDLAATRSYVERHPRAVEAVEIAGIRTSLCVPMVKDNELIGIIGVFRQQVRPFNDKQIELVTDFAAQAVIAIESARLLNELRQRTTDLTEVWSSRQPRRTCSELSAVRLATFSRYSRPSWRTPSASATPTSGTYTVGMATPCTLWRHTRRRLPSRKSAGAHPIGLIQILPSAICLLPRPWFTSGTSRRRRRISHEAMRERWRPWNLQGRERSWEFRYSTRARC